MTFPASLDPEKQDWLSRPGLRAVWAALEAAGGRARIVGGAVRDALLGKSVKDVDLACDLPPEQVIEALEKAGLKAVPTGIAHGTVTAVADGKGYEITTLRRDVETDGRRAKVSFTDDWRADAARRDFTFNALYLDAAGRIEDYEGGLEDLAARRVRFIGDPRERIREDVLRILRFFRFLAQMADPDKPFVPDPKALEACREAAALLKNLSPERVWKELARLLAAKDPAAALRLMEREGVLSTLFAEPLSFERLAALIEAERFHAEPDAVRRFGAFLKAGHKEVAERLRLSRKDAERLVAMGCRRLDASLSGETLRQFLYDHGKEKAQDALLLAMAEGSSRAASLWPEIKAWENPIFPLEGKDVLALGVAPGPRVGRLLKAVEAFWRKGDFKSSRAACLEELKRRIIK